MATSTKEQARLQRLKENQQQKQQNQKRKKTTITIVVIAVLVAVLIVGIVLIAVLSPDDLISGDYVLGTMSVKLNTNKTFTAKMGHDTISGTYKIDEEEIAFTYDNQTVKGSIVNNELTVPAEWDDDHGHVTGAFKRSYTGTYELDGMKIVLNVNSFSATLSHDVSYAGTYTIEGSKVLFSYGGETVTGKIIGDELTVPHAWDDGHGHISGPFIKQTEE